MAALLSKENEGANDWPRKGGWKMEHAQAACQPIYDKYEKNYKLGGLIKKMLSLNS